MATSSTAEKTATQPVAVKNTVPTLQKEWHPEWRLEHRRRHPRRWLSRVAAHALPYILGTAIQGAPFDDDEVPDWLQQRQNNEAHSTLYRLPDEILLHIRDYTDSVTQTILRQTCSLFLRMVVDLDQKGLQKFPCTPRGWLLRDLLLRDLDVFRSVPLRPNPLCFSDEHVRAVRAVRARADERFCAECRDFRTSGAFGEAVRRLQKGLWCSGCGCVHAGLVFSAAQRAAPREQRICIGREGGIVLCEHITIGWQDEDQAPDETVRTCFEHHSGLGWSYTSSASPTATRHGSSLWTSWVVPAFDVDPTVPVTRAHLRSFLAAQGRRDSPFSRAGFCPHVAPNDSRLLLPFEPGQCVCFADPATTEPEATEPCLFHAHAWFSPDDKQCCRCRAKIRAGCVTGYHGRFLPADAVDSMARGTFQHTYVCQVCEAQYSWVRPVGSRVYMHFVSRYCSFFTPTDSAWLERLHPDTWAATEDQALHRVTWCVAPHCQTGITL